MDLKTELIVRHYECDAYGHVNNANYLNYLEHARGEYLKQIGFDYNGFMEEGFGIYVVRINISYKCPALPDDILTVRTKPIKRKRATGVFYQEIKKGEVVVCEAEVTWASIGKAGKMAAIPDKWDVPGLSCEE